MAYPVEEMDYKMKFINDKINNGEALTSSEVQYAKKISSFGKIYDVLCLNNQLRDVEIDKEAIRSLLEKKKQELIKIIKGTKSKNKLPKLYEQVNNIEEFMRSDALEYFKDFLLDNNSVPTVDIDGVFRHLALKDKYLTSPWLSNDAISYQMSPFVRNNRYLKKVSFNRPLIDLTRRVIMGDFTMYNALKEGKDTLDDGTIIPDEMRQVRLEDISAIIYYGRGRVGQMDDHTFDTLKDDLDILVAIDQAQKGVSPKVDDELIKDSIRDIIMGIISGKHKVSDFTRYHILGYFDQNVDTTKFREILRDNRFDLDMIQRKMLQDDLLRSTTLNGTKNLFVDDNGELQLANISLASSVMNGEEINDESLSADLDCLKRIKYYNPAHRSNPHEYEKDKYDVKILLAIARYKEELKKKLDVEETRSLLSAS